MYYKIKEEIAVTVYKLDNSELVTENGVIVTMYSVEHVNNCVSVHKYDASRVRPVIIEHSEKITEEEYNKVVDKYLEVCIAIIKDKSDSYFRYSCEDGAFYYYFKEPNITVKSEYEISGYLAIPNQTIIHNDFTLGIDEVIASEEITCEQFWDIEYIYRDTIEFIKHEL